MRPASNGPRKRRHGVLIALSVLCAATIMSLTQCVNVADRITGSSARGEAEYHGGGGTSRCFSRCRDRYEKALEKEEERHERNVEKCKRSGRGDRRHNNRECLEEERARHRAAVEQIEAERRQCQAECHHQGGGSGR